MSQQQHPDNREPFSTFRSLSNRNYRFYFAGSVISLMGRQMLLVALGWDIYEKTGSALALGMLGLAEVVPVILFTLLAGHAADHINRKSIILLTQLVAGFTILGIAISSVSHWPIIWMYIFLGLFGMTKAFLNPARNAILPQIVSQDILTNALTWNTTTMQIALVAGPALAGLFIAWQNSAVLVYFLSALCAWVFFILMIPVQVNREYTAEKKGGSLAGLSAGLRYVWQTKTILAAITLDLFAVLFGGAVALLPMFAKDILHVGPVGLGLLQSSPSVGALIMALILARHPIQKHAGPAMLWCVAGFGLATIVFGLSKVFWLSFLMLGIAGALDNISVVVRNMLIQYHTPHPLLGRVSAINYMFIGTSNELGSLESGLVAHFFGPVISVVSGGIGTIVVVLLTGLIWPEIRKLDTINNINTT